MCLYPSHDNFQTTFTPILCYYPTYAVLEGTNYFSLILPAPTSIYHSVSQSVDSHGIDMVLRTYRKLH